MGNILGAYHLMDADHNYYMRDLNLKVLNINTPSHKRGSTSPATKRVNLTYARSLRVTTKATPPLQLRGWNFMGYRWMI